MMLKEVKVGGIRYKIEFPYKQITSNEWLGIHIPNLSLIKILDTFDDNKLKWSRIHETFLHEVFHAIDGCFCKGDIEHNSITQMSIGWYQVLRDNNLNIKNFAKAPKKVKVGGFIYDVEFVDFIDEVDTIWGKTFDAKSKIFIKEGRASLGFLSLVLCVSIGHAIRHVYLNESQDEALISMMESFCGGIHQVLCDNNIEEMIKNGIRKDSGYKKKS